MSRDPDCDVHVHLHPDEKCTCPPGQQPHAYVSTACYHGLHSRCRRSCKFCSAPCGCPCGHPDVVQGDPPRTEASDCVHIGAFSLPGAEWMRKCPSCHAVLTADQMTIAQLRMTTSFDQTRLNFRQETIDGLYQVIGTLEAELLRLNGPTCPYDGKRASEHDYHPHLSNSRTMISYGKALREHEWAPEILRWCQERWLRENAR